MDNFSLLFTDPNAHTLTDRKSLKQFIINRTNNRGNTFLVVRGECRLIKYKSKGLGLYDVYTVEWSMDKMETL
jgi:hypothetical protein